jgi:RimJ/RimL family protein N-acetyltransferase
LTLAWSNTRWICLQTFSSEILDHPITPRTDKEEEMSAKETGETSDLYLRDVVNDDLPIFFEQQSGPDAITMAAFTAKDPTDRKAFSAHWSRILAETSTIIKTIVFEGQVAGHVLDYEESGEPEVSYWIGKEYWGKGIATQALSAFLAHENRMRPIYARVAKDNIGSLRVLEKCGFTIVGEDKGFANARGEEIAELILELEAWARQVVCG